MWRQTESLCIVTASGTIVLLVMAHQTRNTGYMIIYREKAKYFGESQSLGQYAETDCPSVGTNRQ